MWGSLLIGCLALAADGAAESVAAQPTPLYVFSRQTSTALRREAVANETAERAAAIRGLCELHRTLLADARYEQVDKLQDLRGRIYSRLRRIQTDLKRQFDKADATDAPEVAARLAEADQAALAASDSLAATIQLVDSTVGGPSAMVAFGGRAVLDDNGQELVDLIERTINPAFWDVNGGPGTIVYYQPLQCLVVRGSGEIHHRLGGFLGDMRAAGR